MQLLWSLAVRGFVCSMHQRLLKAGPVRDGKLSFLGGGGGGGKSCDLSEKLRIVDGAKILQ